MNHITSHHITLSFGGTQNTQGAPGSPAHNPTAHSPVGSLCSHTDLSVPASGTPTKTRQPKHPNPFTGTEPSRNFRKKSNTQQQFQRAVSLMDLHSKGWSHKIMQIPTELSLVLAAEFFKDWVCDLEGQQTLSHYSLHLLAHTLSCVDLDVTDWFFFSSQTWEFPCLKSNRLFLASAHILSHPLNFPTLSVISMTSYKISSKGKSTAPLEIFSQDTLLHLILDF